MPEDFEDFEDLLIPYERPLPDQLVLLGADGTEMRALLLDGDKRLVMATATQVHYAKLPIKVPNVVGKLQEKPASGVLTVIEINIVNVTGTDRTLTLYVHDDIPGTSQVFACPGWVIPANGRFQWRGVVTLETKDIWGVASAANALYAFFSVRNETSSYRI